MTPSGSHVADTKHTRRWQTAIPRLSQLAVEHVLLLPLGAAIALVWANTAPESYYSFALRIRFGVNDVAMMFYFGLIAKEVVEATAPGGVLHSWRRAWPPVIAAIGATAVPALLYLRTVELLEEPALKVAWPVSLGIDVAVTYLFARLIFGRGGTIPFLLLLTIVANALGFLTLGIFDYTRDLHLIRGALIMAGRGGSRRRAETDRCEEFLAVPARCRPPLLDGVVLQRPAPGSCPCPDRPFPAACRAGSWVPGRRTDVRSGCAQPVRGVVALSGTHHALLLWPRQRWSTTPIARTGNVGAAARAHHRQARGDPHGSRCRHHVWHAPPARRWLARTADRRVPLRDRIQHRAVHVERIARCRTTARGDQHGRASHAHCCPTRRRRSQRTPRRQVRRRGKFSTRLRRNSPHLPSASALTGQWWCAISAQAVSHQPRLSVGGR